MKLLEESLAVRKKQYPQSYKVQEPGLIGG